MSDGFPSRFAAEAGFLIILAVGLGLADLRPALIVGVMAGGWLLVTAIELLAWRAATAPPVVEEPQLAEAPSGWDVQEILVPEAEAVPDEPEALTTVLPPAPEESLAGQRGRRRRRARRSE